MIQAAPRGSWLRAGLLKKAAERAALPYVWMVRRVRIQAK